MTDTRARQAAAGPDVVWRLRRLGELNGGWPLPLEAAAAIEARDAEIARLREALGTLHKSAQYVHSKGAVPGAHWLGFGTAIIKARAALAPPPASDATPPPAGWPTLENVR